MTLAALRAIPLKMLPFDNKNELLLVLDLDEGTTLERTDAAVRDFFTVLGASRYSAARGALWRGDALGYVAAMHDIGVDPSP